MDCESPTPPQGMLWSVYYARIKCRCLTGWGEAYILYSRDNRCCVATTAGTTKIRDTAASGCHLHATRRECFSRTFCTHINMFSSTSNIYLVPGTSYTRYTRQYLAFSETNIRTTWNIHMCAVGYSNQSLNPQYPALRSFNRLAKWISIPGHGRSRDFVTR